MIRTQRVFTPPKHWACSGFAAVGRSRLGACRAVAAAAFNGNYRVTAGAECDTSLTLGLPAPTRALCIRTKAADVQAAVDEARTAPPGGVPRLYAAQDHVRTERALVNARLSGESAALPRLVAQRFLEGLRESGLELAPWATTSPGASVRSGAAQRRELR